MSYKALIIDDDPGVVDAAADFLASLRHEYDWAWSQQEARRAMNASEYSYILLDIEIPARSKAGVGRVQNSINLLEEIRSTNDGVPVIIMAPDEVYNPGMAVKMVKQGATDFVRKPFLPTGRTLDKAIKQAIAGKTKHTPPSPPRVVTPPKSKAPTPPVPFRGIIREMVIYEDRITVCGIEVWRDRTRPDVRKILLLLSQKKDGKFVHISGSSLARNLGRNPSNPVGRPIKDFRDSASRLLIEQRKANCGKYDIIARGSDGYHFTEWMTARVAGSQAHEPNEPENAPAREPDEPKNEPVHVPNEPANEPDEPMEKNGLNDRQHRILAEIDKGTQLRQKDVIAIFRRNFNPSTVKRDLKGLRDRSLIETHSDGYYMLVKNNQATRITGSRRK